jgi:hypothetical protein
MGRVKEPMKELKLVVVIIGVTFAVGIVAALAYTVPRQYQAQAIRDLMEQYHKKVASLNRRDRAGRRDADIVAATDAMDVSACPEDFRKAWFVYAESLRAFVSVNKAKTRGNVVKLVGAIALEQPEFLMGLKGMDSPNGVKKAIDNLHEIMIEHGVNYH